MCRANIQGARPGENRQEEEDIVGLDVTLSRTDGESDPFEVQQQQLQSFIKQAKEYKRYDDILALEELLRIKLRLFG